MKLGNNFMIAFELRALPAAIALSEATGEDIVAPHVDNLQRRLVSIKEEKSKVKDVND